jgi:hypothetical protein
MKELAALLLGPLLFAAPCSAQVEHGGAPRAALSSMLEVARIDLTPPDVSKLLVPAADANGSRFKPLRVGTTVDARVDLSGFSSSHALGGTLYLLAITSPGAFGIGLNFYRFHLPPTAELFVYTPDRTEVRGAFTEANHKRYGGLSIAPIRGDHVVIELFVPTGLVAALQLATVVHHFRDALFGGWQAEECIGYGCAGQCTVNVACELGSGWEEQAASTVQVLTSEGTTLCSASMVNTLAGDGRQLLLTASHCDQDPLGSAEDWIVLFNYQDPTCADAPAEPSRNATTQGTKLLARRGELHRDPSDFALLEITEPIPDGYRAYLSGWNAEEGETFEQPFGIHHPRGDVKKLNARNGTASTSGFFEQGHTHWVVDRWDAGSTELGSSGSPVFDADQRIRGQLNGGLSSCLDPVLDYYGKLSVSWEVHTTAAVRSDGEMLQPWLDPQGSSQRICNGTWLSDARQQ